MAQQLEGDWLELATAGGSDPRAEAAHPRAPPPHGRAEGRARQLSARHPAQVSAFRAATPTGWSKLMSSICW
jgi:hypothetical protein